MKWNLNLDQPLTLTRYIPVNRNRFRMRGDSLQILYVFCNCDHLTWVFTGTYSKHWFWIAKHSSSVVIISPLAPRKEVLQIVWSDVQYSSAKNRKRNSQHFESRSQQECFEVVPPLHFQISDCALHFLDLTSKSANSWVAPLNFTPYILSPLPPLLTTFFPLALYTHVSDQCPSWLWSVL